MKKRQAELLKGKSADTKAAHRIRSHIYNRPKLLFGEREVDCVVRVSGKNKEGFDRLTRKIVNIATGRETFRNISKHPIFRGHVGARIPRMRLIIREVVKELRGRFKVIAWNNFMVKLQEKNSFKVEDVSDALSFLTDIGEISYFGDIGYNTRDFFSNSTNAASLNSNQSEEKDSEVEEESDDDNGMKRLKHKRGLDQYIFLNPRWLMHAITCILRLDLPGAISKEVQNGNLPPNEIFSTRNQHYWPMITAKAAELFWNKAKYIKKAAERIRESATKRMLINSELEMNFEREKDLFYFLQNLLIEFRVFVPIDVNIDIEFDGKGLQRQMECSNKDLAAPRCFFLPSLLGQDKASDSSVWEYKNIESWKKTVCHSLLFRDSVPPDLMERIIASVLSDIYNETENGSDLYIKQISCWRRTLLLRTTLKAQNVKNSVDIFVHLAESDDRLCVASDSMSIGNKRLIICGKGPASNIWNGGYCIVKRAIDSVCQDQKGLDFEEQIVCPFCLHETLPSQADVFECSFITTALDAINCKEGHQIKLWDLELMTNKKLAPSSTQPVYNDSDRNITDALSKVVLVGLWDGANQMIEKIGSGFIVDKKRGLVMTAAHTLINIDDSADFGKNYFGKKKGKVVIGVIPGNGDGTRKAVFRYFARIVAKDENMDGAKKVCQVDACVLQITTRMERDVDGDRCGEEPEHPLIDGMKREKLEEFKILEGEVDANTSVKIIGFNQGGRGLWDPGVEINRHIDFAKGYVCQHWNIGPTKSTIRDIKENKFCPRTETCVICPTISGHSGGPCINLKGKVIGMLSRTDHNENHRCYLVPASELRTLLKIAKRYIQKN